MIESQAFHMAAEITFDSLSEIVLRPSHDVNCIPLCLPNKAISDSVLRRGSARRIYEP